MPLPYLVGSTGSEIEYWQAWFIREYRAYSPAKDGVYGEDDAAAVREMQSRLKLPETGVFDAQLASRTGYQSPVPAALPIMFTVEGHCSDMFRGPVADTATQLEREGLCHHQPVGYNNAPVPFDNASGVNELVKLLNATNMPNLVPFPPGTPWTLGCYSQGGIIASELYFDYLSPGKPLNWRLPDLQGVLSYANPCRQTGSIADWARPWIGDTDTHGLDPKRRFGLPDYPEQPDFWIEVYRKGDIFAENGDDRASEMKAAVYQAAARGKFIFDPCSLAVKLSRLYDQPVQTVLAIIIACIQGLVFVGAKENAHYFPFELTGGVNWMRDRLRYGRPQPLVHPATALPGSATAPTPGPFSALSADEQRELLELARLIAANRPAASPRALQPAGEGMTPAIAGPVWSTDANLVLLERLAVEYTDPQAIALLVETAGADPDRNPELRKDIEQARRILSNVDPSKVAAAAAGNGPSA